MSTDRDVTRIVRSWLHEDAHEDADRILSLVLDEIDTTPQRRAGWLARRFPFMNSNTFRVAVAAVAVIVIAFIGVRFLLPGSTSPGGPPDATATPIPTVEPTATPIPQLNGQGSLPPGRYRVDTSLPMQVTVDVPAGWSTDTNWVVIGPKGNQAPNGMAIRFYAEPNLYAHPLAPDGGLVPDVGPSVDDLVNAMVAHPDWPTTGHTAVTVDGYAGQVVHLTLPAGTSAATPFYLFSDASGGQIWGWAAGQLFDVYVIDVGGKRLQIDAFHYPGTSAEDLAAQRAVIDTLQLAP
jgi:hypothetical protein